MSIENQGERNKFSSEKWKQRAREKLQKPVLYVGVFAVAALLVLAADHQMAPYSPLLGGRDRTQSPIGQTIYALGVHYQDYLLDQGIEPDKSNFFNRLAHVSPRIWQTLQFSAYAAEYWNDTHMLPHSEGTQFTDEFTRETELQLPDWFSGRVIVASYVDSQAQHIDVATLALDSATQFEPRFAPKIIGYLTAPTAVLAWPDGETAAENSFTVGSNPQRAHGNGTAFVIEIADDFRVTVGSGWHAPSELFPFSEVSTEASLRYGLVVPNDYAKPGTGLVEWVNGNRKILNGMAGDVHDPHYPPTALLLRSGTIEVLHGEAIAPYLEEDAEEVENGTLVQVAYAVSYQDQLPSLNQILDADVGGRTVLLNTFTESLDHKKFSGMDTVWMTVFKTQTPDGSQKTYVSFALNRSEESENVSGGYKIAASIAELVREIQKSGIGEHIIEATTIHTGAQGSTGGITFTRGDTSAPFDTQSFETAEELIAAKQVKEVDWGVLVKIE